MSKIKKVRSRGKNFHGHIKSRLTIATSLPLNSTVGYALDRVELEEKRTHSMEAYIKTKEMISTLYK